MMGGLQKEGKKKGTKTRAEEDEPERIDQQNISQGRVSI